MFINLSNHASLKWAQEQVGAAEALDQSGLGIIDIPFPNIDPRHSTLEVEEIVDRYYQEITSLAGPYLDEFPGGEVFLHLMGELTFCYLLIRKIAGFCNIIVSTTERTSIEEVLPDGSTRKTQIFQFVQFRQLN